MGNGREEVEERKEEEAERLEKRTAGGVEGRRERNKGQMRRERERGKRGGKKRRGKKGRGDEG